MMRINSLEFRFQSHPIGIAIGIAVLVGVSVAISWSTLSANLIYPITNDGAGYIEEARNILEGHGAVRTPLGLFPYDTDYQAIPHFPSGFSLLLAGIAMVGVDVEQAAIWVPMITWMLLPVVLVWAMQPVLKPFEACGVAVLVTVSPGLLHAGGTVLTDIPFLLLVVTAFGLLIRAIDSDGVWYAVLSGATISVAYWFRYAGLAALLAMSGSLVGLWIVQAVTTRIMLKNLLFWAMGVAPLVGLLWLFNIFRFGHIQPYVSESQPLNLLQFIHSGRDYFWDVLMDLTGSKHIAQLAWDFKWFALLVLPVALVTTWRLFGHWRYGDRRQRFAMLLLGLYAFGGSAMVVSAKARYGVVDHIRYVIQYSWAMLILLVLAMRSHSTQKGRLHPLFLGAIGLALLFQRTFFGIETLARESQISQTYKHYSQWECVLEALPDAGWVLTNQIKVQLQKDAALSEAVRALPEHALIASNMAGFLAHEVGRTIRKLQLHRIEDLHEAIRSLEMLGPRIVALRPLYVAVLPTNGLVRHKGWQDEIVMGLSHQFQVIEQTNSLILARYVGSGNK